MGLPKLDHIVILLPESATPEALLEHAEPFKKWFTILPGGFHTDRKTQNVLVSLADGVYLELIAFTSSPPSKDHRWGQRKPTNIVDFAFLGHPEAGKHAYHDGVSGGRGECKWVVTPPKNEWGVGRVPFWCEDVTPRELRVPKPTEQPSGVKAIKKITILVDSNQQHQRLTELYKEIIGTEELKVETLSGGEVIIDIRVTEMMEEQESLFHEGRGIFKVEFDNPDVVLSNQLL
jgi:hypothetical protein